MSVQLNNLWIFGSILKKDDALEESAANLKIEDFKANKAQIS